MLSILSHILSDIATEIRTLVDLKTFGVLILKDFKSLLNDSDDIHRKKQPKRERRLIKILPRVKN